MSSPGVALRYPIDLHKPPPEPCGWIFADTRAMRALLLLLALAPLAAPAQPASPPFSFPLAGLDVDLPEGFVLALALEDHLPETALFAFQREVGGETTGLLHVSFHTYFDARQRAAWLSGEDAEAALSHLPDRRRVEVPDLPLPAGALYALDAGEGAFRYALFGCDEARCYRVDAAGLRTPETPPEDALRALLRGVRFAP
jgi:hypothetical protein